MKQFPKSAMVGLMILSWGLLVVFGVPRWAPPSLTFPAYWGDKDTPGTEGDQVSHVVVYCYGLSTTYSPDDEQFWPIVNAAYQAAEDWSVPWEVVAGHGGRGFQVSPGNARESGVAVDLVYSSPMRPQTGFLKTTFQNDTTQLTFVSEGYVFPHHEDINPLWWNPYWVLRLGHGDVLNRVLAENGCK